MTVNNTSITGRLIFEKIFSCAETDIPAKGCENELKRRGVCLREVIPGLLYENISWVAKEAFNQLSSTFSSNDKPKSLGKRTWRVVTTVVDVVTAMLMAIVSAPFKAAQYALGALFSSSIALKYKPDDNVSRKRTDSCDDWITDDIDVIGAKDSSIHASTNVRRRSSASSAVNGSETASLLQGVSRGVPNRRTGAGAREHAGKQIDTTDGTEDTDPKEEEKRPEIPDSQQL